MNLPMIFLTRRRTVRHLITGAAQLLAASRTDGMSIHDANLFTDANIAIFHIFLAHAIRFLFCQLVASEFGSFSCKIIRERIIYHAYIAKFFGMRADKGPIGSFPAHIIGIFPYRIYRTQYFLSKCICTRMAPCFTSFTPLENVIFRSGELQLAVATCARFILRYFGVFVAESAGWIFLCCIFPLLHGKFIFCKLFVTLAALFSSFCFCLCVVFDAKSAGWIFLC
mmetsp:Transcript_14711/g.17910  ORF Transcript_14711/g.17910 Transcript_14711/m.17910 type:complete len:225 (+) Transcript_14711:621-1295(+)